LEKLDALFESFGVDKEKRGVPAVFFDRKFLAGDVPINRDFYNLIESSQANYFPNAEIIKKLSEEEKAQIKSQRIYIAKIPVRIIIGSAFLDIFNPCSLAILIFLLWIFFGSGLKKKIFIMGTIFSLAIFFSHLFLAIFFYNFSGIYFWQKYLSILMMVVAFIFGFINLEGFFWQPKGRFFSNKKIYHLFFRWHEFKENAKNILTTKKSFFVIGIFASFFLWSYPNEPYQAMIESLKEERNFIKDAIILFSYNIVFIAPFLLISWILERFSQTKKLDIFGEKIFKLIKVFLGVIMLFVGFYLIFN